MRILVVGTAGNVGKAAVAELKPRHEVITAGRSSGDVRVDLLDAASISAMYEKLGKLDAVVACAGHAHYGPLASMTETQFMVGLKDKLMGQVNLVLLGTPYVNDRGSFTLTSGAPDCWKNRRRNMKGFFRAMNQFRQSGWALPMQRALRAH